MYYCEKKLLKQLLNFENWFEETITTHRLNMMTIGNDKEQKKKNNSTQHMYRLVNNLFSLNCDLGRWHLAPMFKMLDVLMKGFMPPLKTEKWAVATLWRKICDHLKGSKKFCKNEAIAQMWGSLWPIFSYSFQFQQKIILKKIFC